MTVKKRPRGQRTNVILYPEDRQAIDSVRRWWGEHNRHIRIASDSEVIRLCLRRTAEEYAELPKGPDS